MAIKIPKDPKVWAIAAAGVGVLYLLTRRSGGSSAAAGGGNVAAALQSQAIASDTNVALSQISAERDASIAQSNSDLAQAVAAQQGALAITEIQAETIASQALATSVRQQMAESSARTMSLMQAGSDASTAALQSASDITAAAVQARLGFAQVDAQNHATDAQLETNLAQINYQSESLPYLQQMNKDSLDAQLAYRESALHYADEADYRQYMHSVLALKHQGDSSGSSTGSTVGTVIGGVAGGIFGGPAGAAAGASIGGSIGGSFDSKPSTGSAASSSNLGSSFSQLFSSMGSSSGASTGAAGATGVTYV